MAEWQSETDLPLSDSSLPKKPQLPGLDQVKGRSQELHSHVVAEKQAFQPFPLLERGQTGNEVDKTRTSTSILSYNNISD